MRFLQIRWQLPDLRQRPPLGGFNYQHARPRSVPALSPRPSQEDYIPQFPAGTRPQVKHHCSVPWNAHKGRKHITRHVSQYLTIERDNVATDDFFASEFNELCAVSCGNGRSSHRGRATCGSRRGGGLVMVFGVPAKKATINPLRPSHHSQRHFRLMRSESACYY